MFQEAKFSVENREKEILEFVDKFLDRWEKLEFSLTYCECSYCHLNQRCLVCPFDMSAICKTCATKLASKEHFKNKE